MNVIYACMHTHTEPDQIFTGHLECTHFPWNIPLFAAWSKNVFSAKLTSLADGSRSAQTSANCKTSFRWLRLYTLLVCIHVGLISICMTLVTLRRIRETFLDYPDPNDVFALCSIIIVWCSGKTMHIVKIIQCCFIVDSECNTIFQNKTVDTIKIFQPELDLQHF